MQTQLCTPHGVGEDKYLIRGTYMKCHALKNWKYAMISLTTYMALAGFIAS